MKKSNKINVYVRKSNNIIYVDYLKDGKRVQKSTNMRATKNNLRTVEINAKRAEKSGDDIKDLIDGINEMQNWIDDPNENVQDGSNIKDDIFSISEIFLTERKNKGLNSDMYEIVINQFLSSVGNKLIFEINEKDYFTYKAFLDQKDLSYHSMLTYIKYLHIFFKWCIDNNYYSDKNPVTKLKARDKNHITTIDDEHIKLILENLVETPIYYFIKFLHLTAFRRAEALKLKWEQVDFKNNIIRVITYKDNQREDTFPLVTSDGQLKNMLEEMYEMKTTDNVFNLNMHANTILQILRKSTKHLDLPHYTIHDIRRTTISKWATKVGAIELTKLARHRSIRTTMQYYINIDMKAIGLKI